MAVFKLLAILLLLITCSLASQISTPINETPDQTIGEKKQVEHIADMKLQIPLVLSGFVAAVVTSVPGATSYVVPTAFSTSIYSSYYGEYLNSSLRGPSQ